ncbi:MAG: NAD(P)H-dependent oxidoreductase [Armatimonadetes bacterium]|nr:NAD(P)H-dependent oxidoreductase [Armatimonadota bacterium]
MAKMLIAYYSRTGHTKRMAEVIGEAAKEEKGVEVDVKPVDQVQPEHLLQYDCIILGSPVYYGTMAAPVKQLLDESVRFHGQLDGKLGGAFASSGGPGGGNETTVLDLLKALMIHGMIVKGMPTGDHYGPIAVGMPDERSCGECRNYGRMMARLAKQLFS